MLLIEGSRRLRKFLILFSSLLCIVFILAACSSGTKKEDSKEVGSGIVVRNPKTKTVNFDNIDSLPNSEAGASEFAFKVASVVASTDVQQQEVFEKVISKNQIEISTNALVQRNKSESLPRITFSPVGLAIDNFSNQEAIIAIVGLSFESSSKKVISTWKEARLTLAYEKGWKIVSYDVINVQGPPTDGSELSSTFLTGWSGYYFPPSEISSGQKTIMNQITQDFGTVDENGSPVTFPPGE